MKIRKKLIKAKPDYSFLKGIFQILCIILIYNMFSLAAEDNFNIPPSPTKIKPIYLPMYKSFTLKNGLKVYLIENHKISTVSYFLYLDYLPKVETKKAGLSKLTARFMKQGAGKRNKHEIDEELDFMGTDLQVDDNLIFANSLSKYSKMTLEIVSDIVKSPIFEESEFLKIKEDMISEIQSDKQNPDSIAVNIAKSLLYGRRHPYGEILTEKSIKRIQIQDCMNFHRNYIRPNISHLAIMGDIGFEEAIKLTDEYFTNWEAGIIPKPKIHRIPKPKKTKIYLLDRPDSVQSVIKITNNIKLRPEDSNLYSAVVMNTILGGGTFRLYQNLREKHGYTYGVYSSIRSDKLVGNFSIDLNTMNSITSKSIKEVFFELNRIRKYKIDPEEIQLVKNYLSGQFSLSLENPSTIALFAIKTSLYNLPNDYYDRYLYEINKVTAKDVLSAANRYILPRKTNIIVVGKKKELLKSLKSMKKYKIVQIKEEKK